MKLSKNLKSEILKTILAQTNPFVVIDDDSDVMSFIKLYGIYKVCLLQIADFKMPMVI